MLPDGFVSATIQDGAFDGLISHNELDGVLLNWAMATPPALGPVPEPAGLGLMLLTALLGTTPRRTRAAQ